MLSTQMILTHFRHIEPRLMDIVIELRNLIAEAQPGADETFQRNGLVYYDASRGGHVSANICQISFQEGHVRLAFIQGAFLEDPYGLLRAEGERIAKRFIDLYKFDAVPWEELKDLIKASVAFDPYNPHR
jgi:hypothetical protein